MINFFRKFRKKLLIGNNFSKYLIYAIGEIILLVIGILIALQINNYNERRKDRNKEQIVLRNLNEDFLANQKIIDRTLALHQYHLHELHLYLKHLGPNVSALTDSIYKFDVSDYGTLNLIDGTLQAVINSDILGIIQNELLKKKLSTYPSSFAYYKEFEDVNRDIVINKHRALGEQYTSILRLDTSLLKIAEPHKSDFLGWARDPQHQNNTVNRINIIRNKLIPALIEVQAKNYEILKLLEEEIKDK
ncbi:MAG: DUF6090 family protein [Salegentibacter sp.]